MCNNPNFPFGWPSYISIFPPTANYVGFWRLISPHMATALLISTSWRTEAWQQACQSHHQKRRGAEEGGWAGEENACLCVRAVCFCGREARRKEKLARENKVNEPWRRLPSSVLERRSRASSFTLSATLGARTENNSLRGGVLAGGRTVKL